jgi:hypothetical protein
MNGSHGAITNYIHDYMDLFSTRLYVRNRSETIRFIRDCTALNSTVSCWRRVYCIGKEEIMTALES